MIKRILLTFMALTVLTGICYGQQDLRGAKIDRFLADHKATSPLRNHIQEILYCADNFGLDYRLFVAIAAAESGYGTHYIKRNHNMTGICNGDSRFQSVYDNIYATHQVIATKNWYRKYQATNNIKDLVYVYKGVPPYTHYIKTLNFVMNGIRNTSVADLLAGETDVSDALPPFEFRVALKEPVQSQSLLAWSLIEYDRPHPTAKSDGLIAWILVPYEQASVGKGTPEEIKIVGGMDLIFADNLDY
ncbi:MAG: hypothetical protein NT099_09120, partial [Candidatus Saganbacteria bacterium]|nr:hypothetical protein [Candidatus Saganbacteria bacterium]